MLRKQTVQFFYHLLAWLGYGIYYYLVNRLNNDDMTPLDAAFSLPFYALVCYVVYYILRRYFANGINLWGFVHLLAFYIAFGLLAHSAVYQIGPAFGIQFYVDDVEYSHREFIQTIVVLLSNYSMFAVAYFFVRRDVEKARKLQLEAEQRLQEVEARLAAEQEKQRYEFVALTGQVSPHLQANLMNRWIVLLSKTHRVLAAEIDKAYQLMKYYMTSHAMDGKRTVTLKEEVRLLEFYMDLFMVSDTSKSYITLDKNTALAGYTIPPTTLLTFLENAMKHGVASNPDRSVQMTIRTDAEGIHFVCINTVSAHKVFNSHGVGLANLLRRLNLLYGDKCVLQYGRKGEAFRVELKIKP